MSVIMKIFLTGLTFFVISAFGMKIFVNKKTPDAVVASLGIVLFLSSIVIVLSGIGLIWIA